MNDTVSLMHASRLTVREGGRYQGFVYRDLDAVPVASLWIMRATIDPNTGKASRTLASEVRRAEVIRYGSES